MHSITTNSRSKLITRAIFLALLYAVSRILYVYFLHPFQLLTYPLEEPYRGAVGMELLRGLAMPLQNYAPDTYSGGYILIGTLASWMFQFFGSTLFSLKLVSISLFSIGLFFWFLVLAEEAGEKTALWFSMLFIFSPPALTQYMLVTLGDHTETIVFQGIGLYFFMNACRSHSYKKKMARAFLCGIASGFGIWISYLHALFALSLVFVSIFFDRRLGRKGFFFLLAGLLVGFSPWIYLNFHGGFQGLQVLDGPIWNHVRWSYFAQNLSHWKSWFLVHVAASFTLGSTSSYFSAVWIDILYSALLGFPILASFQTKRTEPLQTGFKTMSVVGIVYFLLMALAHHVTDFKALRYALPTHAFLFCFAAQALVSLQSSASWFRQKGVMFFCFLWAGVFFIFHAPLLSRTYAGEAVRMPGYNYMWLSQSPICFKPEKCLEGYQSLKPKLGPTQIQELQISIPYSILDSYPDTAKLIEGFYSLQPLLDITLKPYFSFFMGAKLFNLEGGSLARMLQDIRTMKVSDQDKQQMMMGAARSVSDTEINITYDWLNQHEQFSPETHKTFLRHSAKRWLINQFEAGLQAQDLSHTISEFLIKMDASQRFTFIEGVGMGLLSVWGRDPVHSPFEISSIEKNNLPEALAMLRGVGMGFEDSQLFDFGIKQTWRDQQAMKGVSASAQQEIKKGQELFREEIQVLAL